MFAEDGMHVLELRCCGTGGYYSCQKCLITDESLYAKTMTIETAKTEIGNMLKLV